MTTSSDRRFTGSIQPRYTDLDTWRHVNNSRVYQLHLEARIQYLVDRFGPDAWYSDAERLRPLRTITHFRQVTWFGAPIEYTLDVLACSDDHCHMRTELFQNGEHVGTQECLLGAFLNYEQVPLPEAVSRRIREDVQGEAEPLPPASYLDNSKALEAFPLQRELTVRYADLDADIQRGEAALARFMEQARFGAINTVDFGGLGILIASLDITFLHYRPGKKPVSLMAGCNHTGNSSFHLVGGAISEHGLQAVARSVMVMVDQKTSRPTPLTDAIREQLAIIAI